ncbi:MAG: replication initiator protein [Microvirus sp.]|nr:MAG: replication initiator protein [Microvirus sp.]
MCTRPLPARRVNGQIEFLGRSPTERFYNNKAATLQIPCGQCAECRLKRSREWAVRCMHESSLHRDNCFITLTYSDDNLDSPSLNYKHFSDFMKRLRKKYPRDHLSYFVCGEYGETNPSTGIKDGGIYRPHFHAILFGFNFPDRQPVKMIGRSDLFKSDILDKLWKKGNCKIGDVTFESCAYVARYAMKKVTGDLAQSHYTIITPDGEIIEREPEMLHMSKRPAIGRMWFERYGRHAYAHDSVIARGVEMQPPRYYDKLLPDVIRSMISDNRATEGNVHRADHTDARNNVRDVVVQAGIDQFNRE